MRTTLDLDEDALVLAKRYANREKLSLGEAVSQLVRQGAQQRADAAPQTALRGRFALLPARGAILTAEHVRALMASEGI